MLKVISWNINGLKEKLKDAKKTEKLQQIFKNDYDIVLLQETHLGKNLIGENLSNKIRELMDSEDEENQTDSEYQDEEKVNDFLKKCGYSTVEILQNPSLQDHQDSKEPTVYITNFSSKSRGVAILVNKEHKCLKTFCEGGDYAWVCVEIDNQKYTFVSVYYHSKESNIMLRILCSFLTQGSEFFQMPVIGGDFNTTLQRLDKKSIKDSALHKTRRKNILAIMKILDLQDVWREKQPHEKVYTYSCKNPMSRLDYVFMLEKDLHRVQNCDIWQDNAIVPELSDHYPVTLTLTI